MNPLIDVQKLSLNIATGHIFQGKKNILQDISFHIQAGCSTAYLGANGAGKSSTFRILSGLMKADSGKIFFDGQYMPHGLPPSRFGFMPEQPYFYKNLTPQELLTGLGKLSGLDNRQLKKNIPIWAEKLHFAKVLNQRLSTCSKGQVQRVGLAQALIHRPDFILLDEPLSGLDPIGRACVRNVIHDEIKRGATLLFSSHILDDAEAICDQVIILEAGKTVFSGDIQSLVSPNDRWLIKAAWHTQPSSIMNYGDITQFIDGNYHILTSSITDRDATISNILKAQDAMLISVTSEKKTLEHAFVDLLQKGKKNHEENHASHH